MAPLWPNWLLFQDQVPFLAHPWCFTIPPSSFRAVVFLLFFAMPQPRPISSTLEKNAAEFFSIRASTLGEWNGGRRPDSQRNAVVHGGSIAADIETIRWCEVFEQKIWSFFGAIEGEENSRHAKKSSERSCQITQRNSYYTRMDQKKWDLASPCIQSDAEGRERQITFLSKRLSAAEKNYWATELEVGALVWGISKLRTAYNSTLYTEDIDILAPKLAIQDIGRRIFDGARYFSESVDGQIAYDTNKVLGISQDLHLAAFRITIRREREAEKQILLSHVMFLS